MTSERDPKSVPIHLAFGEHSGKHTLSINSLLKISKSYLDKTREGKVLFFSEAAGLDVFTHKLFNTARYIKTSRGISQLDAVIQLYFVNTHHRNPSDKEQANIKKRFIQEQPSFSRYLLRKWDSLDNKYPGRTGLLVEGGVSEEKLTEDRVRREKMTGARYKSSALVWQGRFLEALPFFQEEADLLVEEFKRDKVMAENISDGANEDEVIAIVGHAGGIHTGIYHNLRQEGYNITPIFPQKESKTFLYPPGDAAARSLHFSPEKIYSQEQWLKTLIQHEMFDLLKMIKDAPIIFKNLKEIHPIKKKLIYMLSFFVFLFAIPRVPQTTQGALRLVYKATSDFDMEKIKAFEDLVKQNGFVDAAVTLMKPHLKS